MEKLNLLTQVELASSIAIIIFAIGFLFYSPQEPESLKEDPVPKKKTNEWSIQKEILALYLVRWPSGLDYLFEEETMLSKINKTKSAMDTKKSRYRSIINNKRPGSKQENEVLEKYEDLPKSLFDLHIHSILEEIEVLEMIGA